jgi:hypothetical protein
MSGKWSRAESGGHTCDKRDAGSARLQQHSRIDCLMVSDGTQGPLKWPPDALHDLGQMPRNFTKHPWATAHIFREGLT